MKVHYPVKEEVDIKLIKETLKPFGGRCAKYVDGQLNIKSRKKIKTQLMRR